MERWKAGDVKGEGVGFMGLGIILSPSLSQKNRLHAYLISQIEEESNGSAFVGHSGLTNLLA